MHAPVLEALLYCLQRYLDGVARSQNPDEERGTIGGVRERGEGEREGKADEETEKGQNMVGRGLGGRVRGTAETERPRCDSQA